MSSIRLYGSTSGYTEIVAQSVATNSSVSIPNSGTLVAQDANGNITITGVTTVSAGSASTPSISPSGDPNTGIFFPAADTIAFAEGGTESFRVDSSGRMGIGRTSISGTLDVQSASGDNRIILRNTGNTVDVNTYIGATDKTSTTADLVLSGRENVIFNANLLERMRITSVGDVYVKRTDAQVGSVGAYFGADGLNILTASGQRPLIVNRLASDGDLVVFYQDSVVEGSISVSGSTVSYNGAHLSRWSQLPGGTERTEILRGTVLSNIDEMCEWGEEDNEQLNRMKVSDVEGDPNVAGVFQGWDDDDDTFTNDFYCAMTGDFIIRIAEGVAVQRGDLLMSAGDGTAKPQDDDIVRSKTVAKVTSTHITCTYDDGSYCVPCVLMAC